MTRAELAALLAERENAKAAEVRRALQGRQKPAAEPTQAAEPRVTEKPVSALSASDVKRLLAFNRAVGAHGFSDEQVADLEALMDVQRPDDISGWVAQKAKAFGVGKTAPTTATQATTPAPSAPVAAAPQATQPPAPMPAVAPAGSTQPTSPIADRLAMSQDQMSAYLRSLNFNVHNRYAPASRKAIRTVAEEGRRLLENVQVLPPDRGKSG
jgi:hypothetical protein